MRGVEIALAVLGVLPRVVPNFWNWRSIIKAGKIKQRQSHENARFVNETELQQTHDKLVEKKRGKQTESWTAGKRERTGRGSPRTSIHFILRRNAP